MKMERTIYFKNLTKGNKFNDRNAFSGPVL